MKNIILYIAMSALLTSCASAYQEIGGLGMLTDRHIDATAKYRKIATGIGSDKKEIKATKALNIKDAIERVLNQVPGAEYITNVKIYAVKGDYLAVSGDVWGMKSTEMYTMNRADSLKGNLARVGTR